MIFDNFDANMIMKHEQIVANSAKQFADITDELDKSMEPIRKANEERHNAILQTAQAAIDQKKLLEEQNAQLKENYSLLKELYENAKKEAQNNLKEAKRSRIFGFICRWYSYRYCGYYSRNYRVGVYYGRNHNSNNNGYCRWFNRWNFYINCC